MNTEPRPTPTGWVQVLVLLVDRDRPAPEPDGIAAVALASVLAYAADPSHPDWQRWLSGPVTKSVRRADAKMYAKTSHAHPEAVEATQGRGRALALPPLPMDDLPKTLARLQVSGTQLPAEMGKPAADGLTMIVLNQDLGMSTGKAAAQAAHSLFAWVVELEPQRGAGWLQAGPGLCISWREEAEFLAGAALPGAGPLIRDAGRTEIAPGSATAYVAVD